jgi:hypothetical protein
MTISTHNPATTPRPRRTHRLRNTVLLPLLTIVALIALIVAITVTGHRAAPPPPATGLTQPHSVRYEVSGSTNTRFSISYVTDSTGSMSKAADQALPWSADVGLHPVAAPFAQVTVKVVRGAVPVADSSGVTACRIIVDGRTVAENHTSAQSAFVDCDAIVR